MGSGPSKSGGPPLDEGLDPFLKVRTGIQGSADVTETGDRRILTLFEGEASVGLGELHGQGLSLIHI